ncbi:MAG: EAL domain-containing protein [Tepidisphaeraceae bacterium]|jgi:diguanylate cyclase (GGDEF)-like protein
MNGITVQNYRLLVIDDNKAIHEDFRKILTLNQTSSSGAASMEGALFGEKTARPASRINFQIDSAFQGQQGLEMAEAARKGGNPYAAAFVDMRMPPGWDGLRTIRELWHIDPDLNFVICTAFSDNSWLEIDEIAGDSDRLLVLKKPFEPIEIKRLAATLTAKWTLSRRAALKMSELENLVSSRTLELQRAATHDRLTGLPNRALFHERLSQALALTKRQTGYRIAVMFLDFDRFKVVNDSLGHECGDLLLQAIGGRLASALRGSDVISFDRTPSTIARLGGDEFCILLASLRNDNDAALVAERIMKALGEPYDIGGHQVHSTASIGIAVSTSGYERAEDMIRDADTAMYRAKAAGKDRFVLFDKSMHEHAMRRLSVESELRRAVEKSELMPYYQPIVSLETGLMIGAEALVRWQHPQRGLIEPTEFMGIAEESSLVNLVGSYMLKACCRQMRDWQLRSPGLKMWLSINISNKQLAREDFVSGVDCIVQETGVDPASLIFEITETALVGNTEHTIAVLKQLKERGIRVYLDDFGTGYSSLNMLRSFCLDGLKIDRSFVRDAVDNRHYSAIIQAIIDLARNLGMGVVAEGIESHNQMTLLQAMNCQVAQGFLFSHAVPDAEFEKLMTQSEKELRDTDEAAVA